MTVEMMKKQVQHFNSALGIAKMKLDEARTLEAKRKQLVNLAQESDSLIDYLDGIVEDLRLLNLVVSKEEIAFKKRRLGFIETCLTEQMDFIFPKKRFRAETDCNFDRRKMKLRLKIIDPAGYERPPHKTEGKLNQQLISATSAYGCTRLLGKSIMYMDEPFSASSEDNLIKLQQLLYRFVQEGFQIILVSQSPLLFADLERRYILLRSQDGLSVDHVEYQDISHVDKGGLDESS